MFLRQCRCRPGAWSDDRKDAQVGGAGLRRSRAGASGVRTGGVVPMVFWLGGFEEPFGAVGGESTVGPVSDEQHVVRGEPELAVGVLRQWLVRGQAQGGSNRAGHNRRSGVIHKPLLRCRVQQRPERSHVNPGARVGAPGAHAALGGSHVTRV